MNVLVVGGGGREHALVWKIVRSPMVTRLYCAPGNPGISDLAECVDIAVGDLDQLAAFAQEKEIGLTVIGPEAPLSEGVVDRFEAAGLTCFGPSGAAARLESSKTFAKQLMAEQGIPTGGYAAFSDPEAAIVYIKQQGAPVVVKADGLAAGKGVTVAHDVETAIAAIRDAMVDRAFGAAGSSVIVEECLLGEEASILALSDGERILSLSPSQDHKPVFDSDEGPNTGGMGAYAPAPVISEKLLDEVERTILKPCIEGMAAAGTPYRGVLYAGLMITDSGPKVIEFNCRFGDPEAQVVLPLIKSDIVPALLACCKGELNQQDLQWDDAACVTVVMASGGYPGGYEKGKEIRGIEDAESDPAVTVFHAGTKRTDGRLVTNGGRVLNVTAAAESIPDAIARAYRAAGKVSFDGAHFRTDIGAKALDRLQGLR